MILELSKWYLPQASGESPESYAPVENKAKEQASPSDQRLRKDLEWEGPGASVEGRGVQLKEEVGLKPV